MPYFSEDAPTRQEAEAEEFFATHVKCSICGEWEEMVIWGHDTVMSECEWQHMMEQIEAQMPAEGEEYDDAS